MTVNDRVITPDGPGTVLGFGVYSNLIRVRLDDGSHCWFSPELISLQEVS